MVSPSLKLVEELTHAYDYFNQELFDGTLPECVVLLHRKRGARGYFWPGTWVESSNEDVPYDDPARFHELSVNPDHLKGRSLQEVLSTLVHEQVHLRQQIFGKPGKNGTHNRQWADWMENVGLVPSSTGAENGKKTGKKMCHYIAEGGRFIISCQALIDTGFILSYMSDPKPRLAKVRPKKTTYRCPECEIKAVALVGVKLSCTDCEVPMEPKVKEEDHEH